MKALYSKTLMLIAVLSLCMLMSCGCGEAADTQESEGSASTTLALGESPEWIAALPQAEDAEQLFVVAAWDKSTAWISLNEKDENGTWQTVMTTPGFIGKNGLGKTKEGDGMTPVGTFHFNKAFGIADDPGCSLEYTRADEDYYWSGDVREGMHYNELVSLVDYPDLNVEDSEHILDYPREYQYVLNISYNEECTPGLGSAIFLHCLGPLRPCTGGCIAIPQDQMLVVMQNVRSDCVVVIDTMANLGADYNGFTPEYEYVQPEE